MKKIIPLVLILALTACAKNTPTDGGSWIFHSTTYKGTQAYYVLGGLAGYTGTGFPTGSLALWFYSPTGSWDTVSTKPLISRPPLGSYILTNSYPPAPGYAFLQITDSSLYNSWKITGSTTPVVTVSASSTGMAIVTIPPVMVVNTNTTPNPYNVVPYPYIGKLTGTDSSLVSATIKQTK